MSYNKDLTRESHIHKLLKLTSLKNRSNKIEKILTVFNRFEGLNSNIWELLEKDKIASKEEIEDIQLSVNLSLLTKDNVELVKVLKEQLKEKSVQSIRDLALFSKDDWLNIISKHNIILPDSIEDNNATKTYVNCIMENFRGWEANRKIFLYPENWIEPELRNNKSPIFKELEDELLQGELKKETVEKDSSENS